MNRWIRYWPTLASVALVAWAVIVRSLAPAEPAPVVEPPPEYPSEPQPELVLADPRSPRGPLIGCSPPYPPPVDWDGDLGWPPPFRRQVFHHSELTLVKQVAPEYPAGRVTRERCLVKVTIDPGGVPTEVKVEVASCGPVFAEAAEAAVRQWRWEPPHDDGTCIYAATTVGVTFTPDRQGRSVFDTTSSGLPVRTPVSAFLPQR